MIPADDDHTTPAHRGVLTRADALDLLRTLVEATIFFLLLTLVMDRFEIHSVSMEPNLHEGQRVIVNKLGRFWPPWLDGKAEAAEDQTSSPFALHRGQVVVFYESDARTGEPLIKRLIGLPGETIQIHDGDVYVDGTQLSEPYVNAAPTACVSYCGGPITLGPDQYFFLGDNRANSRDSRYFGPVPARRIVGPVVVRYWPPNKIGLFP